MDSGFRRNDGLGVPSAAPMIVTDPAEFLAAYSPERFPVRGAATARAAFLVAPAGGTLAAESAGDNRYMDLTQSFDASRALAQHAELARRLGEDVPVVSFPGSAECPDGMFPNNVFGTAPGRFIVGRMRHACAVAKPNAPTCARSSATRSAIASSTSRTKVSSPS
jgi:hypothetical protein